MEEIILLAAAALVNNVAMFGVKWIGNLRMTANGPEQKRWLQIALAVLSLTGVVITAGVSGNPVDPNSISSISETLGSTAMSFFASHGAYNWLFRNG